MDRRFNPAVVSARLARPAMRAERLESRDVPSAGMEDVYSMPHLDGMSSTYPIDTQPPAHAATPLVKEARGRYAVGTGGGGIAQVNVYDAPTGALLGIINPFGRSAGPVTVATGDVNGDGIEDVIVAAGRGQSPQVKVYDGSTLKQIGSFRAYSATFTGGVTVAVADVTGDGRADVVTGAGVGSAAQVKVFSGADLFAKSGTAQKVAQPVAKQNFLAFDASYRGGITVAAGDLNGDGHADVVVGQGPGGSGVVRTFDGRTGAKTGEFTAFAGSDLGVSVAVGDVTGDGKADVVAGAMRGTPTVRVFSDGAKVAEYAPFTSAVGVRVALQDINGDGVKEVLAAASGGAPSVKVLAGATGAVKRSFPAVPPSFRSGLTVG